MTVEPVGILLVEDHPTFLLGLQGRISLEADLEVVATAASAEEAIPLVDKLAPDVAVVDLHLPGMGGIELIRELGVRAPATACLVLTMADDESVFAAVRAGARGYLLKDTDPTKILAAIRAVAGGDVVLSGGVAARLLAAAGAPVAAGAVAFPELTEREREVLTMMSTGLTNTEIGRRLELRPKTVRNYVSNVLTKLQVADRAEAIVRARGAGLGGD